MDRTNLAGNLSAGQRPHYDYNPDTCKMLGSHRLVLNLSSVDTPTGSNSDGFAIHCARCDTNIHVYIHDDGGSNGNL